MAQTSSATSTANGYSIQIELHGQAFTDRDSPSKVYQPRYQKYLSSTAAEVISDDFVPHLAVEYKDVITTWKGLTPAQAKELYFWEKVFKRCFQDRVEHSLIAQFQSSNDQLKRLPIPTLLSHMYDFVTRLGPQRMTIDLNALIDDMIQVLMKQGSHHTWFSSSGSIRTAIANFLMSRDCFLGTYPFPLGVVNAQFSAGYASEQLLIITCDVAWVPPRMVFADVEAKAEEKQDYYLLPRFAARLGLGRYETYPYMSQHNVTSDDMGFAWENELEGFHGITPPLYELAMRSSGMNNPLQGMTCRFDTECIITQYFPGGVRLERVLRNRISLRVMPSSKRSNTTVQSSNSITRFVQQQASPMNNQLPLHTPRSVPVMARRKAVHPEPFQTPLALRVRSRKDTFRKAPTTDPHQLREGKQTNPWAKSLERGDAENKALEKDSLRQDRQHKCLHATEPTPSFHIQVNPWLETTPTRQSSKPRIRGSKLGDAPEEHAGPSTGSDVPEPATLRIWNKNLPAWRLMSGLDQLTDHGESSVAPCQSHFSDCSTSTKVPNSHDGMSDDELLPGHPHTPDMASTTSVSHIDLPSPVDEVGIGKRFPPLREMLRGGSGSFTEMQAMHALRADIKMPPTGRNPFRSPKASSNTGKQHGALVCSLLREHLIEANRKTKASQFQDEHVHPKVFRGPFHHLGSLTGRKWTSSSKPASPSMLPQIHTLRQMSINTPSHRQASNQTDISELNKIADYSDPVSDACVGERSEPQVTGKGKRAANSSFDIDSDTHESIAPPTRRARRDSLLWDSADDEALPSSPKKLSRKQSDSTTWERIRQFVLNDLQITTSESEPGDLIACIHSLNSTTRELLGESESMKHTPVQERLDRLAKMLLDSDASAKQEVKLKQEAAKAVQEEACKFQHKVQEYYNALITDMDEVQTHHQPRKRYGSDEMAFEAAFFDEDNDVDMTDSGLEGPAGEHAEEQDVEETY